MGTGQLPSIPALCAEVVSAGGLPACSGKWHRCSFRKKWGAGAAGDTALTGWPCPVSPAACCPLRRTRACLAGRRSPGTVDREDADGRQPGWCVRGTWRLLPGGGVSSHASCARARAPWPVGASVLIPNPRLIKFPAEQLPACVCHWCQQGCLVRELEPERRVRSLPTHPC